MRAAWPFAGTGVIVGSLAPLFVGQFARAVNPIHRFAAGMWIGTLFVLVVAGSNTVLRQTDDKIERGTIAADLINAFSPLALGSFLFLAASGVWTAWNALTKGAGRRGLSSREHHLRPAPCAPRPASPH